MPTREPRPSPPRSGRRSSCEPATRLHSENTSGHTRHWVAEQFGTLEALFPGRIDLGLGRAPGPTKRQDALRLRIARLSARFTAPGFDTETGVTLEARGDAARSELAKVRETNAQVAARKKGPSELEQVERRITTLEANVEQLEAKLAEDWTNMDMLTGYRTSRDELQELLARWQALFETA